MKRKLQTALIVAVAVAAGIGGYLANRNPTTTTTQTREVPLETVNALLALSLADTEGQLQALEQWRGKVIVANFWATWCPPCREEMPALDRLQAALPDLAVVPVATGRNDPAGINRLSDSAAQMVFYAFSAVMGLSIAWIFAVFTGASIAQTFFVTAIAFAGLSLWGYTTKKDISGWGSFLRSASRSAAGSRSMAPASRPRNIWCQCPATPCSMSAASSTAHSARTSSRSRSIAAISRRARPRG